MMNHMSCRISQDQFHPVPTTLGPCTWATRWRNRSLPGFDVWKVGHTWDTQISWIVSWLIISCPIEWAILGHRKDLRDRKISKRESVCLCFFMLEPHLFLLSCLLGGRNAISFLWGMVKPRWCWLATSYSHVLPSGTPAVCYWKLP